MEFKSVYQQEIRGVYSLLVRLGAPRADLPDLAHDIFVTAMRKWPTFDASRPVRPWLLGITWRIFNDFIQKARPVLTDELPELEVELRDSIEIKEAQTLVHQALSKLPYEKRAAFSMHELEGYSVAEIADATGVPVQTMYSRLRTAREEFATAVRRIQRGER